MALTLVEGSGPTWRYHQRYLLTGLDEVAALRLSLNGVPTNLAVVSDRQGSFLMAVDAAGAEEPAAGFYLTGPFGQLEPGSAAATDGGTHAGLGFTGAGTATPSGGYVYLRNRWYDPRTGRFLSQDPIGLAGGVNLYAYAGNNPVAYSDPFGLCRKDDAACKDLVKQLRAQKGSQFQQAANIYESETHRRVRWVPGDDRILDRHGLNRDDRPISFVGGITNRHEVRLNYELAGGDRLIAAAHEANMHMTELHPGLNGIDNPNVGNPTDHKALMELDSNARSAAPRYSVKLHRAGYDVGTGDIEISEVNGSIREP